MNIARDSCCMQQLSLAIFIFISDAQSLISSQRALWGTRFLKSSNRFTAYSSCPIDAFASETCWRWEERRDSDQRLPTVWLQWRSCCLSSHRAVYRNNIHHFRLYLIGFDTPVSKRPFPFGGKILSVVKNHLLSIFVHMLWEFCGNSVFFVLSRG